MIKRQRQVEPVRIKRCRQKPVVKRQRQREIIVVEKIPKSYKKYIKFLDTIIIPKGNGGCKYIIKRITKRNVFLKGIKFRNRIGIGENDLIPISIKRFNEITDSVKIQ